MGKFISVLPKGGVDVHGQMTCIYDVLTFIMTTTITQGVHYTTLHILLFLYVYDRRCLFARFSYNSLFHAEQSSDN